MKLDVPTGNAPVASVLQTEWFTCSIRHGNWSGAWDLHPPGRLHRPECCWLHHHLVLLTAGNWILRPESHRHRLLYERSALLALPRRNENTADRRSAPARTCTSTLRLRTATRTTLTPREHLETFASCRCRPGPCGLEDRHARCYINDAGLNKLVAEFGIAPNSPRLQRGANLSQLFSLWGKWSLHEVTLLGLSIISRWLCF